MFQFWRRSAPSTLPEPRDLLPLLAKEGLLAMPAGATRKITSIAGIDCVGITDRGIRLIWPA